MRAEGGEPDVDRVREAVGAEGGEPDVDRVREAVGAEGGEPDVDRVREAVRAEGGEPDVDIRDYSFVRLRFKPLNIRASSSAFSATPSSSSLVR